MKKLFSMILALTLVLGMSTVALATDAEPTGTITVNNVTDNTLLDVYQILTYTVNQNGTGYSKATFANDGYKGVFIDAIHAQADHANANLTTDLDILLYITNNLSTNSDFAKTLGEKLQEYMSAKNIDTPLKKTVGTLETKGQYKFENVATGYYLILDKTGYTKAEDATVRVILQPMNPNITVNLKTDSKPAITKTAAEASYYIGEKVPYTITIPTPNFSHTGNGTTSFVVTDILGKGATAPTVAGDYTVKLGNQDLIVNTDYTFEQNTGNGITTTTFTFASPDALFAANIGKNLVITYSATVNEDAGKNGVVNEVTTNGYFGNPRETSTTIRTYGFTIDKHDSEKTEVKLQDVKFALYTEVEGGTALTFTEKNGTYYYDANGTTTLVTDADGAVVVWGLKAGTYYLEETETNLGYNKLTARVKVVIVENGSPDVTVDIANTTAIVLPSTGGMGTTLFTVLGGGLMLTSALALALNKKRLFNR